MKIIWTPSPNFSEGNWEKTVIVIHKTLGYMPGTLAWLKNPASQVSTNYLITKKGIIYQLVKDKDMAWHAGRENQPSGRWKILDQPGNNNKFCIGIEFECLLGENYTEKQYESGVWLINKLGIDEIVTHKDIAIDKPDLERERTELLRRLNNPPEEPDNQTLILRLKLKILQLQLAILKILKSRNK